MPIVLRLAVLLCAMLALTGWVANTVTYRYKLTLTVDTPDGIKSAYSVVEVDSTITVAGGGLLHSVKGEALYLDLGQRPLIALLGCHWDCQKRGYYHWTYNHPAKLMVRLMDPQSADYRMEGIRKLAKHRGPLTLTTADLPSLVTFEDAGRPASIKKVDPDDLSASFGPGVRWKQMTIEVTDEPRTVGIADKLPWIKRTDQSYPVPGTKYKNIGDDTKVTNNAFKE